jgi:hypothetical protein
VELLAKQTCIGSVAMTTTVVRCPHCVLDDEFREMIARPDGRFVCQVRPLANPGWTAKPSKDALHVDFPTHNSTHSTRALVIP